MIKVYKLKDESDKKFEFTKLATGVMGIFTENNTLIASLETKNEFKNESVFYKTFEYYLKQNLKKVDNLYQSYLLEYNLYDEKNKAAKDKTLIPLTKLKGVYCLFSVKDSEYEEDNYSVNYKTIYVGPFKGRIDNKWLEEIKLK